MMCLLFQEGLRSSDKNQRRVVSRLLEFPDIDAIYEFGDAEALKSHACLPVPLIRVHVRVCLHVTNTLKFQRVIERLKSFG